MQHTFDFSAKLRYGFLEIAEFDCTYVSQGWNDHPYFTVAGFNPETKETRPVEIHKGDAHYDLLLNEMCGLYDRERCACDTEWAVSRREYDREMARAAE